MKRAKLLYLLLGIQGFIDALPIGDWMGLGNPDRFNWMIKDGSELIIRCLPFALLILLKDITAIKSIKVRTTAFFLLMSSAAMYVTNYAFGDIYDFIFDISRGALSVVLIYFTLTNKEK